MSREGLKKRERRSKASQLVRFLRREGKKYCAVALCASLIAGNIGNMAVAADDGTGSDYEFELDRVSLYEALQEAVAEDNTVDKDFEFAGEAADTYESLLEADGTLYELKPEIEDNHGALNLRIFARLEGEIEFDSAYEIDGSEEMIFLLTNTSDVEKTAVIHVDDKGTEEIKVAPRSAIQSDDQANPYKSAAEMREGSNANDTAVSSDGIKIEVETEKNIAEEEESNTGEFVDKDNESDSAATDLSDNDVDISIDMDAESDQENIDIIEDSEVSVDESEQEGADNANENGSADDLSVDDGDGSNANDVSEDAEVPEMNLNAAISYHKTYQVTATPSDVEKEDEEEATPSDATDSDAAENILDGMVYEAVCLEGASATAFVTTFEDMDITNILALHASPSNAGRMHEADLGDMTVQVWAKNGVLPENAELQVTRISEDDETASKYQEAKAALDEAGTQYTGMVALDISFADEDGQEIEPDGNVQVSIKMNKETLPNGVAPESMAVHHLKEEGAEITVQPVADITDDTSGNVKLLKEEAIVTAEFEVDSFSMFTITWESYFTINVYYVNTDGDEINGSTSGVPLQSGNTIELASYAENADTSLNYLGAHYGSHNGSEIDSVVASTKSFFITLGYKVDFKKGSTNVETLEYDIFNDTTTKIANVYLVYGASSGGDPSDVITEKSLSKSKTATYIAAEDAYELELSVSGAVGSSENPVPVDVLLIIDKSGSMKWTIEKDDQDGSAAEKTRRIDYVASSVKTLTDVIKENKGIDARYSVVTFSNRSKTSSPTEGWISDVTTVNNIVSSINPDGGTNYQEGILQGKRQLDDARKGAQTIVIFLSDGLPTRRNSEGNGEGGNGNNDSGGYNIAAAVEEIKGMNCTTFYAIGVGPSFSNLSSTAVKNLEKLCNAVNVQSPAEQPWYAVTSTGGLTEAFNKIAADTTTFLCDHVVVADTLSGNVQPVVDTDGVPKKLVVTVINNENNVIGGESDSVTLVKTDQNDAATIKASYKNGQVKLEFPANYKLEPYWTYKVTILIDATETAYQNYRTSNGYTDTPDANTGTHSNPIDNGFYSNTTATVSYEYNGETKTEDFDRPVIQIRPGTLVINKTIAGLDAEDLSKLVASLKFNIKLKWSAGDMTVPVNLSSFTLKDGVYSLVIEGLSPNTNYTVTETNAKVDGYDFIPATVNATGTISKGGAATAVFNNTYEKLVNVSIKKQVDGNMGDRSKMFRFTVTLKDGNTSIAFPEPESGSAYTLSDDKKTVTFDLSHNDEIQLTRLPIGAVLTVTEDNDGYDVNVTQGTGTEPLNEGKTDNSVDITLKAVNDVVVFTNTKTDIIDAGVLLDSLPYALILGAVAAGIAFYVIRKRKEDENDLD